MKVKDILSKVNKSEQFKSNVDIQKIAEDMNIYDVYGDNTEKITSYFIGNWYCTDSYVGYRVYFFDDMPIAISEQLGRKCKETFEWVSIDIYKMVKNYILSLSLEEDDNINILDLNEEDWFGETYKIEFNCQLFDYQKTIPLYLGRKVIIIELEKNGNYYSTEQEVKIKFDDGLEKWVELHDLDFPYNLI